MRWKRYPKDILILLSMLFIIYSVNNIGSLKVVHADAHSDEIVYEDFYDFDQLPESDIILTDTFELITANRGSTWGVNHGPSLDPNRSDVVVITQDEQWQFGGLWYRNPIDMNKDFSMLMYTNLGDKWDNGNYDGTRGADGITFTIQGHTNTSGVPLKSTLGANGAGLGAYSKDNDDNDPFNPYKSNFIRNALILEFDTFYNNHEQNTNDNGTPNFGNGGANGDKFYGHIDLTKTPPWRGAAQDPFYKQHDVSSPYFKSPDNLQDAADQDLTDKRWRKVEVDWDSSTYTLTYNIAGYDPIVYQFNGQEDVIDTFGGSLVYWGFTGSTGDSHNLQQVGIFELPDQTESTIEKLVRNITKDGENAEFSDEAIMKLGDTVEYQVTLDYPEEGNTQEIIAGIIKDDLPAELSYLEGSLTVKLNGVDVEPTPDWNDGEIHLGNFNPGSEFVVTYQAVVEQEVVIDNTAMFYSRYTNPISDTAQIYSGSLNIVKVDGSNQPLEGAEFTVEGPNDFELNIPREGEEISHAYKIDYLEPGDYVITETKAPDGYMSTAEPQTVTIEKGTVDLEVVFINYKYPELIKEQKNSFEDDSAYGDTSETLVGDTVDFKITSSLPEDITKYKEFRILDELDSRLTYVKESAQLTTNSNVELERETDYTVQWEDGLLVVELTEAGISKLTETSELNLIFTAQVNETTLGDLTNIPNQATIEFINQSDQEGNPESNETNTIPLTGRVDILKIFKNDLLEELPLPDAVFRLQIKSGETWEDFGEEQISDQDGKLHWSKLPKGKYRIIEVEAPEGYLLLANPIEFEIDSDKTTHEQSYMVENTPKEELPQTGGVGSLVFTVTGLLLMISAGLSLFTSRFKKINYR